MLPVKNAPPQIMDHHQKMRFRAAAFRVTRLYPGAIGEMLSRELLTWEEFGYRLGSSSLIMRAVDDILKAQIPTVTPVNPAGKSAVGY